MNTNKFNYINQLRLFINNLIEYRMLIDCIQFINIVLAICLNQFALSVCQNECLMFEIYLKNKRCVAQSSITNT